MTYSKALDPKLHFFETTIENQSVHITKLAPRRRNFSAPAYQKEADWIKSRSVQRLPELSVRQPPTPTVTDVVGVTSETVSASVDGMKLRSIACKIQLDGIYAEKLADKNTPITTTCASPCIAMHRPSQRWQTGAAPDTFHDAC